MASEQSQNLLEKLAKRLKRYSECESATGLNDKKVQRCLTQLASVSPRPSAAQLHASRLPAIVNRLRHRMPRDAAAAGVARRLIKDWRLELAAEKQRLSDDAWRGDGDGDDDGESAQCQDNHHASDASASACASADTTAAAAADSDATTSCSDFDMPSDPVRVKCIEMLQQALLLPSSAPTSTSSSNSTSTSNSTSPPKAPSPPRRFALSIEAAVFADNAENGGVVGAKYKARFRCLLQNLRDPRNPALRACLLQGQLVPADFARMTSEQLASQEMRSLRQRLADEAAARLQAAAKPAEPGSSLFTCKRCRKRNCTYNQLQTLPGDEPMTTYVVCNECGFRWKFN